MSEIDRLAARLVEDVPPATALAHIDAVITFDPDDEIGGDTWQAHAAYNVALIKAIRRYCEDRRKSPPWLAARG